MEHSHKPIKQSHKNDISMSIQSIVQTESLSHTIQKQQNPNKSTSKGTCEPINDW